MHIAFILDGNRRWAKDNFLPEGVGHKKGIENFKKIVKECAKIEEIKEISAFALSTENLTRSKDELDNLFKIFNTFANEIKDFVDENIQIIISGRTELLPEYLQKSLNNAVKKTKKENPNVILNLCIAYGGKSAIVQSVKKTLKCNQEINEENIIKNMNHNLSPIDLLIRTGNKKRISNFMLWELAYSEIFFSEKMWPAFSKRDLIEAIDFFKKQKRTFGQ